MFQFGTDDEDPEGLATALLGAKATHMPDVGLGAALGQMPNSVGVMPAAGGAGSNMPDTGNPEAAPASDSAAGELGKMLAQLYEAGKFKSGYLSKIFGSVSYANLAEGGLNTSIQVGLGDIQNFEQEGDHFLSEQGSVINWQLVDWSKYGADRNLPPEVVMGNFLRSVMNSSD